MASFYCVVNPVSGKGKALPLAHNLSAALRARGHQVTLMETLPRSDDFRAACRAIAPTDRVICIGGDGTLLYFLNHCESYRDVAFYGMGTANVISLEFAIPRPLDQFIHMLEADHCIYPRTGLTQDGTRFMMMCSFGIDAFILAKISQRWKNRLGKAAFLWPTLRALLTYAYPPLDLELDGARRYQGSFALISRFRHYGGPYRATPLADPCGPGFQVVIFTSRGALATMRFLARLARGRLVGRDDVVLEQAHEVALQLAAPAPWFQLDGDHHRAPVTRLTVAAEGFPLVVPRPASSGLRPEAEHEQ